MKEAKLEAAVREESTNILIEIEDQLEMTSTGQLTVNFEPRVKFPAYMLATHNQSRQGRRRILLHKKTVISKQEHEEVFVIKSNDNILVQGVMGGYDYLKDPYFKDYQFDDDIKKS